MKQLWRNSWAHVWRNHRFLLLALVLGMGLSAIGLHWGRVECWNPDQMANRKISKTGLPMSYLKPPLHTYVNFALVSWPVERVMGGILRLEHTWQFPAELIGSRLVTLCMFGGSIAFVYFLGWSASGSAAAAFLALWMAGSAGFIAFNHYLTADMPLIFWMLASLFFAVYAAKNDRVWAAIAAGLLAGLATADKYNGLAVALAIPVALLAAQGWRFILRPAPWMAGIAVPAGFLMGNPGAIFDRQRFIEDFIYNLKTTPVYGGQTEGNGYLAFLGSIPEVLGWPGFLALGLAVFGSLVLAFCRRWNRGEWILLTASFAVFILYFAAIGRFPRMETRFALPGVPFLLLLTLPFLRALPWSKPVVLVPAVALLFYNGVCSMETGRRFLDDPRMDAQIWAVENFPDGATVENSLAPNWNRIPGLKIKQRRLPPATGRNQLFEHLFSEDQTIQKGLSRYEPDQADDLYTVEGLQKRSPDFVAFSSQVFEVSMDPQAQHFYRQLDAQAAGYKKVFEATGRSAPWWVYPQKLDFLAERMVILQRKDS